MTKDRSFNRRPQAESTYDADARAIREGMKLSQTEFATLLSVSVRTLQEWEQGRRAPTGPALSLLRVVERNPRVLLELKPKKPR